MRGAARRGGDVTAIVAGNDLLALGCYDVFARARHRCPEDISVVGFNDMPFAGRFQPPLTTIRIPHYEIGTAAAELMLERLPARTRRREGRRCSSRSLVVRGGRPRPTREVLDNVAALTLTLRPIAAIVICR